MKIRPVTKAIITAAGYGTRFLPATKSVPKEMLPLIDTPIIHYIVEECVNSGITDIFIVTRYGNTAVEDYFDSLIELESFLEKRKKFDLLNRIKKIHTMAHIAFIRQDKTLPYGNASPVISAKSFIGQDSFVLAWGDDVTVSRKPVMKQLIDEFHKTRASACIGVQEIPQSEISRYGSIQFKKGSLSQIERIVEKPQPGDVLSPYASFGRYVFTHEIFNYLQPDKTGKDKELWLVDGIQRLAKEHKVIAHIIEGKWMTTGDPLRFLETTLELALERIDLKDDLLRFLKRKLREESL